MIFDSLVADFVREICRWKSQQTLNCALSVDLLGNQRFRSDERCLRLRAETDYEWSDFVGAVAAADANFRFPHGSRTVFNGEFDSGSERTLAAWIRHASRARFFPVAIQGKV